jgi:ABC-2 type transport system ATP-binding protein
MSSIEVRALVKRYRGADRNAVDGVSFSVSEGQFFGLLGPNGAGKTTVTSILTTTLSATSGSVRIAGRDLVGDRSGIRRQVGVVFQQPSLDINLTGEENVRLHAVLYGLYPWRPLRRMMPGGYHRRVDELADMLGAQDALDRPVRTLSGGTRRKLEIVRALMHRPSVLFLDEPTTGLDPEARNDLWAYLNSVRVQHGTTVFLTTHYLAEAETADALCVLSGGRIIEQGSPAEIKGRHATIAPPRPVDATLEDTYLALLDNARQDRANGAAPDSSPFDGAPFDGAPFDGAPFDAAPFDGAAR